MKPKDIDEILAKHDPYPFSVHSDRYGGSYSKGAFTCFWNCVPPDEVFGGDTECAAIWEAIKAKTICANKEQPRYQQGVGVGSTILEAIVDAARKAGYAV
jgi:hypothetical protein